jgi:DNA-binding CsgD family transcriptional regulator
LYGEEQGDWGTLTVTEILSLITRIAEARRIEAVWDLAVGHFRAYGFSRVNYGLTRFRHNRGIGDPDDAVYLSTADADYVRHYFRGGFYARTPVYRWAVSNEGACTWAWVQKAYDAGMLSPEEMDAVRQNAAMGVAAGIAISFPETSSRSKGAVGLIADKGISHDDVEGIWAEKHHEINAVAHVMHLKIVQLPGSNGRRALTARQREALEWVADGKTMQDVGLLMGVSAAMVEKHLRLARDALDVETTTQAVAKSALMNMIFQRADKPDGVRIP